MISAEPNNFKSWVMLDAAVSLASGRPLFGQFKTEKQSVLIVNEEDYHSQLRTRMMMLYKNWSQLPIYFAIQNGVKLIDSDVEKIISLAKEKGVDFIIFDSLRSLHSAEENSSTEMQAVLDQLKKVTKAGFTVLFSHHNRKKGISSSDNGNESRGSSGINAAVHGHITCEPKEEGGQTFLIISQPKLKGGPKMDPFRVRIDLSSDKPFVYDGAYSKGLSKNELEEEIVKLLEFHDGKGLDIGHFLAANLAGDRRLRETLRVMAGDKRVNPILWKDVQKSGLPVVGEGSNPNEKFYFLPDSLINDDIPP
jgi:archaellum biogenesis ATPase FlaH